MRNPTSRRSAGWWPMASAIDRSVFDRLYRDRADPWSFETSAYEARKRAITLASLPAGATSGFEPGCSIGTLTGQLADRCDLLVAADVSERAVRARASASATTRIPVERSRCRSNGRPGRST